MPKVTYCTKSTITEAWALVLGTPGAVRNAEIGGLENNANKRFGEFQTTPTLVFVEDERGTVIVPPYWTKQLSWDNLHFSARIGHRFLSVHFIKKEDNKYEKYENSLKPQINSWLDAYQETVEGQANQYQISRIGFGYVDTFNIPIDSFNISKYFKLHFGTDVKSANHGLASLQIKFSVNQIEPKYTIIVDINIEPDPHNSQNVILITKVEAHRSLENSVTFEEKSKIDELITEAKETAKSVFFDLATEETHKIMGAQYESHSSAAN